jgi:hypothetical protein
MTINSTGRGYAHLTEYENRVLAELRRDMREGHAKWDKALRIATRKRAAKWMVANQRRRGARRGVVGTIHGMFNVETIDD